MSSVQQEDMSSCSTRRFVFLFNKKIRLLVQPEDVSSCSARIRVFLFNKNICLRVGQECMRVFLFVDGVVLCGIVLCSMY